MSRHYPYLIAWIAVIGITFGIILEKWPSGQPRKIVDCSPQLWTKLAEGPTVGPPGEVRAAIFWDPQCGPCAREISRVLSGQDLIGVRVALHYYPLPIHPDARDMSLAFSRIQQDDQFRLVLREWSQGQVLDSKSAKDLLTRFSGTRSDNEATRIVDADIELGHILRIDHTPAVVVRSGQQVYLR